MSFRLLLAGLCLLSSAVLSFAQSIEIFVETGVPIIGEPLDRTLEEIRDETMTINKDGVVLFSTRWPNPPPFEGFSDDTFLKAEEKNKVSYLIGPHFVLPNNEQVTDLEPDELLMNDSGDFAVIIETFWDDDAGQGVDVVLLGKYIEEGISAHIVGTNPHYLFDLSESGKVLYVAGPPEDEEGDRLAVGSRTGNTIIFKEDTLLPESNAALWYEFEDDLTNASFMGTANPLDPDGVLFANQFRVPTFDPGIAASYYNNGGYTHLYTSAAANRLVMHPYDDTRYLMWIDSAEFTQGWYLIFLGSTPTGSHLIAPTTKPAKPFVAPDGTIYINDSDGGISTYKPNEKPLTKFLIAADADGNHIDVLGLSDSGLLILLSHIDDDPAALFSYNTHDGTLNKFLAVGTLVDGKEITVFGDDQSGLDQDLDRWPVFPIAGNYMATFSNLGLLRINLIKESIFTHTWTGNGEGGKWEDTNNWVEIATSQPPDSFPGNTELHGLEQRIQIVESTLNISDNPVTVGSIDATGFWGVYQALNIADNSSVQDLRLQREMAIGGDLIITGVADLKTPDPFMGEFGLSWIPVGISEYNPEQNQGRLIVNGTLQTTPHEPLYPATNIDTPVRLNTNAIIAAGVDLNLKKGIESFGGEIFGSTFGDVTIGSDDSQSTIISRFSGSTNIGKKVSFIGSHHEIIILQGGIVSINEETTIDASSIVSLGALVKGVLEVNGKLDLGETTLDGTILNNGQTTITQPFSMKGEAKITTSKGKDLILFDDVISEGTQSRIELLGGNLSSHSDSTPEIFAHLHQSEGTIDDHITLSGGGSFGTDSGGTIEILNELVLSTGEFLLLDGVTFFRDTTSGTIIGPKSKLIVRSGAHLTNNPLGATFALGDSGSLFMEDRTASGFPVVNLSLGNSPPEEGLIIENGSLTGDGPVFNDGLIWWNEGIFLPSRLENDGTFIVSGTEERIIDFEITGTGHTAIFPDIILAENKKFSGQNLIAAGDISGGSNTILEIDDIRSVKNSNTTINIPIAADKDLTIFADEGSTLIIHEPPTVIINGNNQPIIENNQLTNSHIYVEDFATLVLPQSNTITSMSNSTIVIDGGFFPALITRNNPLHAKDSKLSFGNIIQISYATLHLEKSDLSIDNSSFSADQIIIADGSARYERNFITLTESTVSLEQDLSIEEPYHLTATSSSLSLSGNLDVLSDLRDGGVGFVPSISELVKFTDSNLTVEDFDIDQAIAHFGGLSGSNVHVHGDLDIDNGGRIFLGSASLLIVDGEFEISGGIDQTIAGGNAVIVGTANIGNLDVNWGGKLTGNGTVNGLVIKNNGLVAPGTSPGILTLNADYEQSVTGTLEIEVGGTILGEEHDQLLVNGNASLGGKLLVYNTGDFDWPSSTAIPVIQANSYDGMFDLIIVGGGSSRRTANFDIAGETLSVTTGSTTYLKYEDWLRSQFTEAEVADDSVSGLLADPDEDNVANLLEYAFDSVPQFKDARTVLSEIVLNEAGDKYRVKVKFPWARGMTDVEYVLQTSPDLETWNDMTGTLTGTEEGEFANLLTVEAEIDTAGNIPIYGRLLVRENEL